MRAVIRLILALGVLVGSCAIADPLDTVAACAAMSSTAQGLDAMRAECPELEPSLTALGFTDLLYQGWQKKLTRDGLRDLVALTHHYQHSPQAAPDPLGLNNILADLAREQQPQPHTWWDAVKNWLRSWFESNHPKSLPWLDRWLEKLSLSAGAVTIIMYVLTTLLIIGVVWMIVVELRAAGLFGRKAQASVSGRKQVALPDASGATTLQDLERASTTDKPAILLHLLVGRLLTTGQLQVERYLTHRELTLRSNFSNSQDRECFARVASLAERVLYGVAPTSTESIESVIADGQVLLQHLNAIPSARP